MRARAAMRCVRAHACALPPGMRAGFQKRAMETLRLQHPALRSVLTADAERSRANTYWRRIAHGIGNSEYVSNAYPLRRVREKVSIMCVCLAQAVCLFAMTAGCGCRVPLQTGRLGCTTWNSCSNAPALTVPFPQPFSQPADISGRC
jgi:hypothetical protein